MEKASLPYAGTSGWSGSSASEERARDLDATGRTGRLQRRVEEHVALRHIFGVTIAELREAMPDEHHGSLSSALTCLSKDGRLLRTTKKRGRCSVYVAPQWLRDGEVALPAKRRTTAEEERARIVAIIRTEAMNYGDPRLWAIRDLLDSLATRIERGAV